MEFPQSDAVFTYLLNSLFVDTNNVALNLVFFVFPSM